MPQECAFTDTYVDIASLVTGLHDHRLDLMNAEAVTTNLSSTLVARVFTSRDSSAMEEVVRTASSEHHVRLRKAILEFVSSRPSLRWVLKSSTPPSPGRRMRPAARFRRSSTCEGRASITREVRNLVTGKLFDARGLKLQSAILHGILGIGKSTIALEVLHDAGIIEHFGDRRFFVGCGNVYTLQDLLGRLVAQLSIDTSNLEAKVAVFEFATLGPVLLVLDNLEDLCPANVPAAGVEDFLSSLTEAPGRINLILTKRGSPSLSLPRTRAFPVETLEAEAAIRAFAAHAHRDIADAEGDNDLPSLVARLDGYPLAIMLLAHRFDAAAGVTARELTAAYEHGRAELLRRGAADNRYTSLRVSAGMSFHSETMKADGAKDLCLLISLLPDGADTEIIEAFLQHRGLRLLSGRVNPEQVLDAKRAVVGAGLAVFTPQRLLRMLAPLRELFSASVEIDDDVRDDARQAIREHAARLVEASQRLYDQVTPESLADLRDRVTNQLGNLSAEINETLASDDLQVLRSAVRQAVSLGEFIYHTTPFVPSFLRTAATRARDAGLSKDEADCLQAIGRIHSVQGHSADAAICFGQALDLHSNFNDPHRKAHLLFSLGDLASKQERPGVAGRHLRGALRLYKEVGDGFGEGNALQALGILRMQDSNLAEAREHLEGALELYRAAGERLGEANTLRSLGQLALEDEDFATASSRLADAQNLFRQMDDGLGEAETVQSRGVLALGLRDLRIARSHFDVALVYYKAQGNWKGEETVLKLLDLLSVQEEASTLGT